MTTIALGILTVILVLAPVATVAAEAYGFTPHGSRAFIDWDFLLIGFTLLFLPGLFIGSVVGIFTANRVAYAWLLVACITYPLLTYLSIGYKEGIRMRAFAALAQRSMPLVHAINRYEKDHGEPPPKLESIVPDYLDQIPPTGIGAYPEYYYRRGARDDKYPWKLGVAAGHRFSFDELFYIPSEDYTASTWGDARIEKLGRWGYLHE